MVAIKGSGNYKMLNSNARTVSKLVGIHPYVPEMHPIKTFMNAVHLVDRVVTFVLWGGF